MKAKLFLANLKIKPVLYAISKRSASRATKCQLTLIAVLCVAVIAANQYINHRSKPASNPWIVVDVISGDRFLVERDGQELEVKLCGISASKGAKEYLRSGEACQSSWALF